MADNYIERKMEELRRGSQQRVMPARRYAAKAGKLSFDFPARRVLLCGLATDLASLQYFLMPVVRWLSLMQIPDRGAKWRGRKAYVFMKLT